MAKRIRITAIIFTLLLLTILQSAQNSSTDILSQYQKIQDETQKTRLFRYEDGAPKGNSYWSTSDNFGYLWLEVYPTKIFKFNGISFQDITKQLPQVERDSLLDWSFRSSKDKIVSFAGRHYIYKWNGYKIVKYAFPKDDRIRYSRCIKDKILAVGDKGYAVLKNNSWKYLRIPIKYYFQEGSYLYTILRKDGELEEWHFQDFILDNYDRLYQLHYEIETITINDKPIIINPEEDFVITRYSDKGIEQIPCITKEEIKEQFTSRKKKLMPSFFHITERDEIYICCDRTEYMYKLNTEKSLFSRANWAKGVLLDSNIHYGTHRNFLTSCRNDTLFFSEIDSGIDYNKEEYYYPHYNPDQDCYILYKNDFGSIPGNLNISGDLNKRSNLQALVLTAIPGESYLNPVTMPEASTEGEYSYGRKFTKLLIKNNSVLYSIADKKIPGVHKIYVVDVLSNTYSFISVTDKANFLTIIDYNPISKCIMFAGQEGIREVCISKKSELLYEYEYQDYGYSGVNYPGGLLGDLGCYDYRNKNYKRLLILHNSKGINQLYEYTGNYSNTLKLMNSQKEASLYMLDYHNSILHRTEFDLTSGKIKKEDQYINTYSYSTLDDNLFLINDKHCYTLQNAARSTKGNLEQVIKPRIDILKANNINYEKLYSLFFPKLIDENTIFVSSGEYQVIKNEKGERELSLATEALFNKSLPVAKTSLVGNPPDKFKTTALIYDCQQNKIYEKPTWISTISCNTSEGTKVNIIHLQKTQKGNYLRISAYANKDVILSNTDFIYPLKNNYLPEYIIYQDKAKYFPKIGNKLSYFYQGKWNTINLDDFSQYGTLNNVTEINNDLWLIFSDTLVRHSMASQEDFTFRQSDGLPENIKGMYELGGYYYIVTCSGIYQFFTEEEGVTLIVPGVNVNGKLYASGVANKFNYKQNNIIIPVDILNTMYPEKIKLTYRLLGYEKNWKQRDYLPQIEYPMLPPGHYEFQIYGTSPSGKKAKPISVFFNIAQPFYATWWAYLIYILVILFAIRGIYKLRTRQLNLRNLALEKTVVERTQELMEKQKHIQESINYAYLIQKSTLPQDADMAEAFASHFVIWKPKATVGGDFYWLHKNEKGEVYFAVIDCTGHGVPGALLSMTVSSLLNHLIKDIGMAQPSAILQTMHQEFGAALHQENPEAQQDGVEISLLKITPQLITFCGAGLNLLYYDPQSQILNQIWGDRYGLGGLRRHRELELTEHNLPYTADLLLYLYTDGITDQPDPDSEKIRRLGNALWLQLVSELASLPITEQKTLLEERVKAMLNFYEQRDDITIVGLQL